MQLTAAVGAEEALYMCVCRDSSCNRHTLRAYLAVLEEGALRKP